MPTDDDIAHQRARLAIYRRVLEHLQQQAAQFGGVDFALPVVVNGLHEARTQIAHIKATLRNWGVTVEDHPDDSPLVTPMDPPSLMPFFQSVQESLSSLPPSLPPRSHMPFHRNPLFIGREIDLQALATTILSDQMTVGGHIVVIAGLGGVGKSQLAVEFAHRYGAFFTGGVFWLNFADTHAIASEIAACGRVGALGLYTDADRLTLDEQVALVIQEWQQPIPRLLIFDNCEDAELLRRWCPRIALIDVPRRCWHWPPSAQRGCRSPAIFC